MTPGDELIFLPLGGSGEIGMNVNLYGCRGKWLMVDLGLTFGDATVPGIDLVLPDLGFIEQRRDDLLGIVLTHGHEDHIGAIPYLVDELDVPLYATPFTAALIRAKLEEEGLADKVELNIVELGGTVNLGPFSCRYVALAHSIPEGNALLIDTPFGRVFHTGDWKLDEEPVLGSPSTAQELTAIGDEGVLVVIGDSTNVFNPEASGSESVVRADLDQIIGEAKGRVVVTTFASNAARVATLGQVARDTGRQLVLAGRSLERITRTAKAVGYLTDFPETVDFDTAMDLPRDKVMIIATGGQGEPMAALNRIASGTHPIKLTAGDSVVFSSKQIPGNEIAIGRIQNQLAEAGIEMVTDRQALIHVSGHPGRPELAAMYGWLKPRIVVPVHGEMRHMVEHARFARAEGVPQTVVPKNGTAIRLAPGDPEVVSHEPVGRLVLDGDVILPADGATINARRRIAIHGYMAVAVVLDRDGQLAASPSVLAQGVPVEEDRDAFLDEVREKLSAAVRGDTGMDEVRLKESLRLAARRTATAWTGKKPIVEVSLITLD
jgi:ribonuclease J